MVGDGPATGERRFWRQRWASSGAWRTGPELLEVRGFHMDWRRRGDERMVALAATPELRSARCLDGVGSEPSSGSLAVKDLTSAVSKEHGSHHPGSEDATGGPEP